MARKSLVLGAFAGVFAVSFLASCAHAAEPSLEKWVSLQAERSLTRVYEAISPADGARGAVIASPSQSNPNYYYHWIRDSALVMREVWNYRELSPLRAKETLEDYALFSRLNQKTSNPSGGADGRGLGEPKFHVDGAAFEESWGRPQNDGPALRVLALLGLADELMMTGGEDFVYRYLYRPELPARTVIKGDLEFVANHWQEPSFDLWEEVEGDHFYTRISQWRALEEGAAFAKRMGDPEAARYYSEQALLVQTSLSSFWSPSEGFLRATLARTGGHDEKVSNVDVAILLGVLHAGKSGAPFFVDDARVVATVDRLESTFGRIFPVNRILTNDEGEAMGPGIGRYPEDRYDGVRGDSLGNPWFLATHAMAEYYLRLRAELYQAGGVRITPASRPFYENLVSRRFNQKSKLLAGDPDYRDVLRALEEKSDAYIRRAKFHTGPSGHQSEQFNREHGEMQGARDLTWNYASFLSLRRNRAK